MRDRFLISSPFTLNSAIETWYIQNILLGGLPYTLDIELSKLRNSLVIYLEVGEISESLIKQAKDQGNVVVLFHMGDELGLKDISLYDSCDYIIRNYYHPSIFHERSFCHKLMWVPNGYRTGVGPRSRSALKRSSDRQFLASFMGWLENPNSYNGERQAFSSISKKCGNDLFVNGSNGFAGGYNVGLYSTVMESSIFSPCPAGNCPDSIRLYEALELGAIPVYLKHEFLVNNLALGGVPFPLLNSWDEFPDFLLRQKEVLKSNPGEIVEMQRECVEWWSIYNRRLSGLIGLKLFELSAK